MKITTKTEVRGLSKRFPSSFEKFPRDELLSQLQSFNLSSMEDVHRFYEILLRDNSFNAIFQDYEMRLIESATPEAIETLFRCLKIPTSLIPRIQYYIISSRVERIGVANRQDCTLTTFLYIGAVSREFSLDEQSPICDVLNRALTNVTHTIDLVLHKGADF